jgi:hypothetical protein
MEVIFGKLSLVYWRNAKKDVEIKPFEEGLERLLL